MILFFACPARAGDFFSRTGYFVFFVLDKHKMLWQYIVEAISPRHNI